MKNSPLPPSQGWSAEKIEEFLSEVTIPIRLASVTETGWPLVLSLWYVYRNGRLYCATQKSAKIITHLRREGRCGFEIAADQPPYRGVRGQGRVTLKEKSGADILPLLLQRYLKGTDSPLARQLLARSNNEVVIEIEPAHLSTWDYTSRMKKSVSQERDETQDT